LVSNWSHTDNDHAPAPVAMPAAVAGAYPTKLGFRDGPAPASPQRRHFEEPDHFLGGAAAQPAAGLDVGGRRHFAESDRLREMLAPEDAPRRMNGRTVISGRTLGRDDQASNWSHTDNGEAPPSPQKVLTMHTPGMDDDSLSGRRHFNVEDRIFGGTATVDEKPFGRKYIGAGGQPDLLSSKW
jgi:hypothetical protein